ncbi:MAG: ABC transporter substrate-binding protein, partial [Deltaproteobacteria bacterium]|nr:ABC transporter substrate-binding protein [Deltaproteobacteria bacterium]
MKKTFLLTTFCFALLFFAFACGGGDGSTGTADQTPAAPAAPATPATPATPAATPAAAPEAAPAATADTGTTLAPAAGSADAPKKILNFGNVFEVSSLDPAIDWDSWVVMRAGVGENLVKFDKSMTNQPWLATSWSVADDKLTWTFKIREGVKFSNGNPLTAEAVKKNFERLLEKSGRFESEFFKYESIEANGQDLIIKTAVPTPGLPGMLADPLFLVIDVTAATDDISSKGPVGTGPYKHVSHIDKVLKVERNDLYWDGKPPFDEVNLITITDPNTRTMALQNGDID